MRIDLGRSEAIERLRCQMISVAEERGSLTHPDVIRISQQLDELINDVQRTEHVQIRRGFMMRSFWSSLYDYKSRVERFFHQYA